MKANCGKESPGPNTYKSFGGIGPQPDGKYATAPSWRQGTGERFKYKDNTRDFPGAGTYNQAQAIGRQTLSNKQSLPSAKIGTSLREDAKKVRPGKLACVVHGTG